MFADEGYGVRHLSTRTHRILWSGWAKTAQAQRRLGVRMNLDAYNYGPALRSPDGRWAHGHLIGSGLPLRFANEDGTLVDCYQQPTQIVDEAMVREFGGPEDLSAEQAVEVAVALIADATATNPAALCGQFHADGFVGDPARVRAAEVLLDGTLAACRQAGVPILTAATWLAFLDGRRATALTERTWNPDSGRLSGTVAVADDCRAGRDPAAARRCRRRGPRAGDHRRRQRCRRHAWPAAVASGCAAPYGPAPCALVAQVPARA